MSIFESSGTEEDEGELIATGINIVGNLFFVFQKGECCIQMCVFYPPSSEKFSYVFTVDQYPAVKHQTSAFYLFKKPRLLHEKLRIGV